MSGSSHLRSRSHSKSHPPSPLSISIDGIEFTIISYDPDANQGKSRIVYESHKDGTSDKPQIYAAYRSRSEMGFWRLCLGLNSLEKGLDYVQSSFIHIELQKFFNQAIISGNLPNVKIPALPLPGCNNTDAANNKKILDHLNNIKRLINIPEIKSYTIVRCADPKSYRFVYKELSDFMETLDIFKVESVELVYSGYTFNFTDKKKAENNKADKVTSMFAALHDIPEVSLEFDANIYCCNFAGDAKLYFMQYNLKIIREYLKKPKHIFEVTNKFAPVVFTPKYSPISEFGTYSTIIAAGAYICKIFDYNLDGKKCQITNKECKKSSTLLSFFDSYGYIGDRYDDIYPYKYMKLKDVPTLVFEENPGSRTRARSRARGKRISRTPSSEKKKKVSLGKLSGGRFTRRRRQT